MDIKKLCHVICRSNKSPQFNGIFELKTEDHCFIVSGGGIYKGREAMKQGWATYFKMFLLSLFNHVYPVTRIFSNRIYLKNYNMMGFQKWLIKKNTKSSMLMHTM
jgi:hypothetical protein